MNIINKTFLKLALLPSGVYRKMGVDIPQLSSILTTKLTMDDRRPTALRQTSQRKSAKPVKWATIGTMLISALLGLAYLFSFIIGADMITHLTFYFSFFFFMLSATLISDFTSVLIDVRDNYIILPKPINDRTFVVSRLLHIFIHICKIVFPMSIPGLILTGVQYGWGGALALLLMIVFVTLFSILFINALYIVILKVTSPQRFQSIISYIQIIFAIVMYGSYQIIPRLVDKLHLSEMNIASSKGIVYYPMYWFACGWNFLYTFGGSTTQVVTAVLSYLLPVISLWVVVKYLAPSFNNKLALISSSATATPDPVRVTKIRQHRSTYPEWLSRIFTRGNTERMGFLFTWKMTARSRDFRMRVYPSIGYLLVYVVIMFMNNKTLDLQDIEEQSRQGKVIVLSALYITSLLLTMAITNIVYSEKNKAAWIYYTSPISRPGDVILGGTKAAIFKFYIPLVAFITVAGLVIVGPVILPNIILGLFNELLIATLLVYMGHKYFPFSVVQSNNRKTGSFLRGMALLMVSGLIAIGHYLIYDILPAVILCALLSIIATWMMMGSIRQTPWDAIRSSYEE